MSTSFILGTSVICQAAAAALALWLIRVTGHRLGWFLIALAITLMAVRRTITLVRSVSGDLSHPPDQTAEIIALIISVMLLIGLWMIVPLFRSITRSEKAMRESEARARREFAELNNIYHTAPIGLCLMDTQLRYVRINEELAAINGRSVEDHIGRALREVVPDIADLVEPLYRRVLDTGEAVLNAEVHGARPAKPNETLDALVSYLPIKGEDGSVVAVSTVVHDITDLNRTQQSLRNAHDQLEQRVAQRTADLTRANERLEQEMEQRARLETVHRESEQRIQSILDHSPAVIYAKDLDGRYLLANRRHADLFHIPPDDVVGKTDSEMFPEPIAEAFRANDRAVLEAGHAVEFEETAPHDDGLHTYISLKFPLFDINGRPYAICGISTDITDRKLAEKKLRDSSAKLARLAEEQSTLLENTRDFLYRHDVDGILTYVSRAVEHVTGYSVDEWRTHYTTYMTDSPINDTVIAYTEETLRSGRESPPYLVEIRHKKGHTVILEVNEKPFREGERIVGVIGVARDVTERVRSENELRNAKNAAEAASRAKSVFLANMSHEIRTPIMALLGAAELADLGASDSDQTLDHRDIILRNGGHLLSLVDDLLDVARMESGTLKPKLIACSLLDIMADVQAVATPRGVRSGVDFAIKYLTPIPQRILTDPTRLTQAMVNLVNNAIKFTVAGHVVVRVAVHPDSPEPRLVIEVEDTGIGVEPQAHEEIFQTFARTDSAIAMVQGGLGLGLPLARSIATQLGGDLNIDSIVGRGSTFTLRVMTGPIDLDGCIAPDRIPRTRARSEDPARTIAPIRLCGHVLLAEDYRDTRELIRLVLTKAGATVTSVENGRQALEKAEHATFDLILMDIRMPQLDGLKAATELRKKGCTAAMIALTASTAPGKQREAIDAGFDDVWAKPIEMSHLLQLVEPYLENEPGQREPADSAPSTSDTMAGSPRMATVRGEFIQSLPDRVHSVRDAIDHGDLKQAREVLHQLTGAGGMFGFMPVSREAARLLKLAKDGTLADHPDELRTLDEIVAKIMQDHHLGDAPPP